MYRTSQARHRYPSHVFSTTVASITDGIERDLPNICFPVPTFVVSRALGAMP